MLFRLGFVHSCQKTGNPAVRRLLEGSEKWPLGFSETIRSHRSGPAALSAGLRTMTVPLLPSPQRRV